jgi:hypothetical protein
MWNVCVSAINVQYIWMMLIVIIIIIIVVHMRKRKMMVECHRWPPAVGRSIRIYRKKTYTKWQSSWQYFDTYIHPSTSLITLLFNYEKIDLDIFLFKVSIVNNHLNTYESLLPLTDGRGQMHIENKSIVLNYWLTFIDRLISQMDL